MADRNSLTRPQFGNRFLSDPTKVFEHNAWDDVEWDSDQEKAAQQKINENSNVKVNEEQQALYEDKAYSFWDEFYMQHQNRFFKDRHWLFTEFPELSGPDVPSLQCHYSSNCQEEKFSHLASDTTKQSTKCACEDFCTISNTCDKPGSCSGTTNSKLCASNIKVIDDNVTSDTLGAFPGCQKKNRILEVGCGVGNTVFPILEANNDPDLFVYCCDFSTCAINLVKERPDYDPKRCHAFVCDITDDQFVFPFPAQSLDTVILIFVLSAVHPNKMQDVICRLTKLLKPGGHILFRDYGRFDMAQLRFKQGKCLSENFYVRGDGTRVYFFTQDDLSRMFQEAGLVEEQNHVDRRLQVNRGRQLKMYRVWIQCKYQKPR